MKYKEGVVRFVKPGFETVERRFRFQDGEVRIQVKMPKVENPSAH